MEKKNNIKRTAQGEYTITANDRIFTVTYSPDLNEWKIYEGEEWWETTSTLRDAKIYIKELI